jgi:ribosomal protein S3AE
LNRLADAILNMPKTTKVLTKRKKFIEAEIPLIKTKISLIANSVKELENKTINMDLTRQLKGKNLEAVFRISLDDKDKPIAYPRKIKLMPYFIRRMIRKRISYVEDSIEVPSQESMIIIKPFLITRKRVSKAIRKTLRNKCKNWIEDYVSRKKDEELFSDLFSNRIQKPLSLYLKKTYPLSLCEIRILEIKRPLKEEEIPKIEKKEEVLVEKSLDQFEEIENEKIKKAEEDIKETQDKASSVEKKERKPRKKKTDTVKEIADKEDKEKKVE